MATTSTYMSTATIRNNLGPLTTTFTPSSACTVLIAQCSTCTQFRQAQACNGTFGATDATTCWPKATATTPTPFSGLQGWGYYSPGLTCPVGYATACKAALRRDGLPSSLDRPRLSYEFQFGVAAGETAVGWCPRSST